MGLSWQASSSSVRPRLPFSSVRKKVVWSHCRLGSRQCLSIPEALVGLRAEFGRLTGAMDVWKQIRQCKDMKIGTLVGEDAHGNRYLTPSTPKPNPSAPIPPARPEAIPDRLAAQVLSEQGRAIRQGQVGGVQHKGPAHGLRPRYRPRRVARVASPHSRRAPDRREGAPPPPSLFTHPASLPSPA